MSEQTDDLRRKSKRYVVHWASRLLLPGKRIISSKVRDVSTGGVGFEASERIADGKEVSIEMNPWSAGKQYSIRAKGVITYGMIKSGTDGFSHGLRFTMISREQFEVLTELLKRLG